MPSAVSRTTMDPNDIPVTGSRRNGTGGNPVDGLTFYGFLSWLGGLV